jgi:hypothetical protein
MKKEIIHSLKLVWEYFKKFAGRFILMIFVYFRFACVSFAASLLIPFAFRKYLGMPYDVAMTTTKVLLTITPIFPTAVYAKLKEEDYNDEFSMDLCFAVWVLTIIFAWWVM